MYIRKLYQQHRGWLLFVLLFIGVQLFINFKRGVVFSPFYHYGMYSAYIPLKDSLQVTEIEVNGKRLLAKDFSPQQWDKILLPIKNYQSLTLHNGLPDEGMNKLMHKLHLASTTNQKIDFITWYKPYLASITGTRVDSLHIYQSYYSNKAPFKLLSQQLWQ
jgi:hypothetical protein